MEKPQQLSDRALQEPVSSLVHIRKFLTLSIGIVVVVLGLGVAVFASIDELASLVPFEMEQRLSSPYIASLPRNEAMDEYLQALTNKLLALEKLPADMQVIVHYVDSNEINAFSTVGGHVFVFRGMLEKLPHENALVMLLAHEIAHIKYRHPLKGVGKGVVASLMLSMLFGTTYSDTVDKVFHDAGLLTVLKFSQDQEIVADEEGMRVYYQYYQHSYGMADLYHAVESNEPRSGELNRGIHSGMALRIQNIKQHYANERHGESQLVTLFPSRINAQLHPSLPAERR